MISWCGRYHTCFPTCINKKLCVLHEKATGRLARNAWVFPQLEGSLHFHAASPNFAWYKQRVSSGVGVFGAGLGRRRVQKELWCCDLGLLWVSNVTRSAKRATSSCSWVTSEFVCWVEIDATVCVITSMTLPATHFRSKEESADASTIRTLGGNCCKNSWRRKELASAEVPSLSLRSCCIRHNSWVSLRSPSSLPLMSSCTLRCSEAAVYLMSSALRVSYEALAGGLRRRSLTDGKFRAKGELTM